MFLVVASPACLIDLGPERFFEEDGGGAGGSTTAATATATTTTTTATITTQATTASSSSTAGGGGGGGGEHPGNCSGEKLTWALQIGGPDREYARSIAPDGQGGLFLSGQHYGTLTLGSNDLICDGLADAFLAHVDANGVFDWSFSLGNSADQPALKVYAAAGGFIAAGSFKGTVDFGNGEETANGEDAVVLRYDSAGNLLWQKIYPGPGAQIVRHVAVDEVTGDIYLGGSFYYEIDLGQGPVVSTGSSDAFIAKLNANGSLAWSRLMTGGAQAQTNAVAFDGQGHLLAGGAAYGDIDVGNGVETAGVDGLPDPWAGLYDAATGAPIWTRVWSAPEYGIVSHVAFDPNGDAIIAGRWLQVLQLDTIITGTFVSGVFVSRLDESGYATNDFAEIDHGWLLTGLALNEADGHFFVSGEFGNAIYTEPEPISTTGKSDGMIIELDSDLVPIRTIVLGSLDNDDFSALALVSPTDIYAVGNFQMTAGLSDCDTLVSAGDVDMLLVKLAP